MDFAFSAAAHPRADEGVVIKKRRRPALACEQCRRRKVKCDRTSPCGPCQRSGLDVCSYRPEWVKAAATLGTGGPPCRDSSRDLDRETAISDWQRQLPVAGPTPPASLPLMRNSGLALLPDPFKPRSSAVSDASSVDLRLPPERHMPRGATTASTADSDRHSTSMRGTFFKSRFYGPSHWINAAEAFQYVLEVQKEVETDDRCEPHSLLKECKRLCRICKAQPYLRDAVFGSTTLASNLPQQPLCDELIRLYLRTFETVYRVLHVPTFRAQYASFQANPDAANPAFIAQLLLVCALGSCFYGESDVPRYTLRESALRWIAATQAWMGSPSEKSRLNFTGLQTQCLLLLARQAFPGGAEMVWISAGSLVRSAMLLGLHHDPSRLPGLGGFERELRKRLWATVLELQIQSSIESGGPPMISERDYDCPPPLNIDESQLDANGAAALPQTRPVDVFTATSMQCALARTLPVRLEIAKYLNDFGSEQTYDDTLRLGNKLKAVLEDNVRLLRSFIGQHQEPSSFQLRLFELLTYRFLLALHFPFAILAKKNPKYYFSHKVCLDLSLSLLRFDPTIAATNHSLTAASSTPAPDPGEDDDYARLQVFGSGLFRNSPLRAVVFVCAELLIQLEDDRGGPQIGATFNALGRAELHKLLAEYVRLLARRVEAGETSVRGHLFFSGLLAHVNALQAGRPSKEDILAAMRESLTFCQGVLRAMAQAHAVADGNVGAAAVLDGDVVSQQQVLQQEQQQAPGSSAATSSADSAMLDNSLWFDLDTGPYLDMEESFLPF